VSSCAELPRPVRAHDLSGQDGVPNVIDYRQTGWRGPSPLEAGRVRRPAKKGDAARVGAAPALVVNEAVIGRAPRRNQPAPRPPGTGSAVGALKLRSGLGDVERRTAEQLLQPVPDAVRQSSDGRHHVETLILKVGPQRARYRQRGRRLMTSHRAEREAYGEGAEISSGTLRSPPSSDARMLDAGSTGTWKPLI